MLQYLLRDLQSLALAPYSMAAGFVEQGLNSPLSALSYSPFSRALAAQASLIERNTKTYAKPSFNIDKTKFRGEPIWIKEELALHHPFCNLIHFRRRTDNPDIMSHIENDPKVLIVTPMSGHFSTLMRGTVEAMLPSHDVYITDWVDAKLVPLSAGYFDLEDQIGLLLEIFESLGPNIHVIGISQASLSVLCATALLSAEPDSNAPATLSLIGGPIDARDRAAAISEVAQEHPLSWFRATQIQMVPPYYPGAMRRVYPGVTQLLDRMSMTLDRHVTEQMKYYQHLVRGDDDAAEIHEKFYDEFLAVMDVPEEFYVQLVERAFQRCDLPNGCFTWRGKRVDPAAITKTALLTIEGELDDLSPPGHTRAALDLCAGLPASMKRAHLEIGVGHYGVFNGRKWRNNIQPKIHAFIREFTQAGNSAAA